MLVCQPEDMADFVGGDPSLKGFVAGIVMAPAHAQLIPIRSIIPIFWIVTHRSGATPGLIWHDVNHQYATRHFGVP